MLTKKELCLCIAGFKALSDTYLLPFSVENGYLRRNNSRVTKLSFYIICVYQMASVVYIASEVPRLLAKGQPVFLVTQSTHLAITTGTIVAKVSLSVYIVEFIHLVNGLIYINSNQGPKYMQSSYIIAPKREFVFITFYFSALSLQVMYFFCLIILKDEVPSIANAAFQSIDTGVNFIIYLIIYTVTMLDLFINVLLPLLAVYLAQITINFWLDKSCLRWPETEDDDEYCLTKCIGVYRCILILMNLYNLVYGSVVVPYWKLLLILAVPLGFYFVIKVQFDSIFTVGFITILLGCGCGIIIPSAIAMSKINNMAMQLTTNLLPHLKAFQSKIKYLYYIKVFKSLPIVHCKIGNFYYMNTTAKLTLLDTVINTLVFLLLTFE